LLLQSSDSSLVQARERSLVSVRFGRSSREWRVSQRRSWERVVRPQWRAVREVREERSRPREEI